MKLYLSIILFFIFSCDGSSGGGGGGDEPDCATNPITSCDDVSSCSSCPDDALETNFDPDCNSNDLDQLNCSNALEISSTGELLYNVNFNIGGFQFDISGAQLDDASGGDAGNNSFALQFSQLPSSGNYRVIGYHIGGGFINSGCGNLLDLTISNQTNLQIINIVFSDEHGNAVDVCSN